MSTIKFSVPGAPVPFMRAGSKAGRRFNPSRYTDYKNFVGYLAKRAMNGREPFEGAIKIYAEFFKPKPRPKKDRKPSVSFSGDVDNFLKAILDAMNGICYVDDKQVVDVHGKKIFGEPHLTIEVEELSHVET